MTEYDYSPEAYEKYLATQSRVSNWVSDQASRMPHYSNPFTPPSNAPSHVSTIAPQPVRAQHHSQLQPLRIPAVDSRSPPRSSPPKSSSRRSHTSPPPPLAPPPNHSQHYSRAAAERPRPAPTRSTTLPNAHMYQPVPPPTTQLVMRPPVHMAQVPPPPPGYKAEYRSYHYDPGRNEIVLPPMRPGETYVIVPPRRGAVEVVRDTGSHSRSASRSSGRSQSKKSTPLFRRILGSISPTGNGYGSSAARGARDNAPPRRLRRHSTSHL